MENQEQENKTEMLHRTLDLYGSARFSYGRDLGLAQAKKTILKMLREEAGKFYVSYQEVEAETIRDLIEYIESEIDSSLPENPRRAWADDEIKIQSALSEFAILSERNDEEAEPCPKIPHDLTLQEIKRCVSIINNSSKFITCFFKPEELTYSRQTPSSGPKLIKFDNMTEAYWYIIGQAHLIIDNMH